MAQVNNLPIQFCIHTTFRNREGYAMIKWDNGGLDANNRPIHILRPARSNNAFYRIVTYTNSVVNEVHVTRKGSGRINRPMRWKYTNKCLENGGIRIPVLSIYPVTAIPSINRNSFVPIVTQNQEPPAPAPIPSPVPIVAIVYNIPTIPVHAVRAILRDAVMQEEVCPITGEEIDVENGAITSCFHLFEKDAIQKWLGLASSQSKCPTCNTKCNSFTIDDVPPLDMHS